MNPDLLPRVWQNGELVPWSDATVSVLAQSVQRASLVFDIAAFHPTAQGTAVFRLNEHVARFLRSARLIGLDVAYDAEALQLAASATIRNSGRDTGFVRFSAFFPSVEPDLVPGDARASIVIAAYARNEFPRAPGLRAAPVATGLQITIPADVRKAGPEVFPPLAKVAASYLGPMLARRRALAAGFDEIVLLDGDGNVAEGPTQNVFAVYRGALVTPPLGRILDGITRDTVFHIAAAEGIEVREEALTGGDLAQAHEVFLASTSLPIGPVIGIDGRAVGSGSPGPVTRAVQGRFNAIMSGRDASFSKFLTTV